MSPKVTLYNSLPDVEHIYLGRDEVCLDSARDEEIIATIRVFHPGKMFDKRKIPALIIEAITAVTTVLNKNQPIDDNKDAHTILTESIIEAHDQVQWASELSGSIFAEMILELANARHCYVQENLDIEHDPETDTKAGKFLYALDGFQEAIKVRGWAWEDYDGEGARVQKE